MGKQKEHTVITWLFLVDGSSGYEELSTSGLEEDASLLFWTLSISIKCFSTYPGPRVSFSIALFIVCTVSFLYSEILPHLTSQLHPTSQASATMWPSLTLPYGWGRILSSRMTCCSCVYCCLLKASGTKFWVFVRTEVVPLHEEVGIVNLMV